MEHAEQASSAERTPKMFTNGDILGLSLIYGFIASVTLLIMGVSGDITRAAGIITLNVSMTVMFAANRVMWYLEDKLGR